MNKICRVLLIIGIIFAYPSIYMSAESIDLESIILKAKNGDAYYQGVLGAIYRRGEMGEINFKKAYKWSQLSSKKNNPIGMYNLAVLYESGIIVSKDTLRANELYAKAYIPMHELATQGDPRAQVNLGYMLELGNGVNANLQEALQWYEKAATAGYPRAQYIVGYKYYFGWGYEKDYDKTIEWFKKAAEQNYPAAQHFLGNMYANGVGVTKSFNEAVEWHKKAEKIQYNMEVINSESSHYVLNGIEYEDDKIIPGLLPPNFRLEILEGSCGESCLWSIINSENFITSQIEINKEGGYPGRGLHVNELHKPLDEYNIKYVDNMNKSYFKYVLSFLNPINIFSSHSTKSRDFLYNKIITKIKQGNPIILGVKIYPDKHFFWDCNHFILLVGYNEKTNELIFNDFDERKRINADKLLDKTEGYSIINRYNFLNYIEIKNFNKPEF